MALKNIGKYITNKILARLIIVMLVLGVVAVGILYAKQKFTERKTEKLEALVSDELVKSAELSTLKYNYSDLISIKKSSLGFFKSYSLIRYNGTIRAGIPDMTKVKFNISRDRKSLTIHIPPIEILGNDIIKQEIFDEDRSIFVPITTQEIFEEINKSKENVLNRLMLNNFKEDAEKHVQDVLQQIFSIMGFKEITVEQMH
jgi:hypothetical protein